MKVDGKELHDQFQRGYLHGNSGFLYKGVAIHVAVPTKVTTGFADKLLQCDTADAAAALLAQYAKQPLERQAEGGGAYEAGDIGPVFVATKEPIPGYVVDAEGPANPYNTKTQHSYFGANVFVAAHAEYHRRCTGGNGPVGKLKVDAANKFGCLPAQKDDWQTAKAGGGSGTWASTASPRFNTGGAGKPKNIYMISKHRATLRSQLEAKGRGYRAGGLYPNSKLPAGVSRMISALGHAVSLLAEIMGNTDDSETRADRLTAIETVAEFYADLYHAVTTVGSILVRLCLNLPRFSSLATADLHQPPFRPAAAVCRRPLGRRTDPNRRTLTIF